jgi:FkbM family methyltransferase
MGIPLFVNKFIDLFFKNKNCVRFGGDAPYWIYPKNFSKKSIVYSAGVGKDVSFELDLIKKYRCNVFVFDPSPTGKETVSKLKKVPFKFFTQGVSGENKKVEFNLPDNKEEGSYSISKGGKKISFDCISVSSFFRKNHHKKIDLVKLDIEGFEYEVLADILKNNLPVNQIVLEYHHHFKNISILKTIKSILALYNAGYKIVYKNVDDFTFVKKSFIVN